MEGCFLTSSTFHSSSFLYYLITLLYVIFFFLCLFFLSHFLVFFFFLLHKLDKTICRREVRSLSSLLPFPSPSSLLSLFFPFRFSCFYLFLLTAQTRQDQMPPVTSLIGG
eukprot:Phypoly_transcript_31486.p1 GENE.Phypoly_transcript_31486~~Phypoly_transcript_31486.p1  ORF type:complete len:118 (+),score=10.63 Phypoly_transcript_31486:25-354(+)